jgi:uncharacterized protein (TIGR03435 family)
MRSFRSLFVLLLATASLSAQTTPTLTFDVASVRQNKTDTPQHSNVPLDTGNVYSAINPSDGRTASGGFFVATSQPLWRYIVFAYKLSGTQELALRFSYFDGLTQKVPTWVTGTFDSSADHFDIEARSTSNPTLDQMRLMMQSLLAGRFHLIVHHETRDAPAFALTLAHPGVTGPNLQPHPASDACATPASADPASPPPAVAPSTVGDLPPVCGVIAHVPSPANPRGAYGGRAIPLSLLATSLPTMTGMAIVPRPVVDRTGLPGLYDFTLHWNSSSDFDSGDTAAAFHEALKTQLGLELKPTRAPIDILIVDHVDHPTEN